MVGIFSRQAFLGKGSDLVFGDARVAVVGLGGGGSHIAQQLAHLGVGNFALFDPDVLKRHNLNRTVGGRFRDAQVRRSKVSVSARLIRSINPKARVRTLKAKWENCGSILRGCDVVFGCVDGFKERSEIESFCRRFLIPYIDIGMDVHRVNGSFVISGQMILSAPGLPCMRCMGFITDKKLALEAARYGDAGVRPQVVWSNGILASLAVGAFVQVFSPWADNMKSLYLEYDGNSQTINPSNRLIAVQNRACVHFTENSGIGDPFWQPEVKPRTKKKKGNGVT